MEIVKEKSNEDVHHEDGVDHSKNDGKTYKNKVKSGLFSKLLVPQMLVSFFLATSVNVGSFFLAKCIQKVTGQDLDGEAKDVERSKQTEKESSSAIEAADEALNLAFAAMKAAKEA